MSFDGEALSSGMVENHTIGFEEPVSVSVPAARKPAKSLDTFTRIEDKYLCPRGLAPRLLKLLETRMDKDMGFDFTHIESVYFDSDDLHIYKSHFMNLPSRFKLRIRRYAPHGIPQDDSNHLELKIKEKGVCNKYRFQISNRDVELLSAGQAIPVSLTLQKLNSKMESKTLLKRLDSVNRAVSEFNLRPMTSVKYVRRGFEREGFRVTIDDGIQVELLRPLRNELVSEISHGPIWGKATEMRDRFHRADSMVLEVKHTNNIPGWMTEFLAQHGIAEVSMSKYIVTMSGRLSDGAAESEA
jgi:SPX domain protein involved in polyphosphate accumulation